MSEEKIEDQDTIIKLQQKLLYKSYQDFESVKSNSQQKLISYSLVLTKSFSSVLTLKKQGAVVRKVKVAEDTGKNVIVYGLAETEH
jgi:methylthioribose-1-phosphate isomerase